MEPEPHKAPLRFYEIDLLRFLSAVSVVLYHYTFRAYSQGNYSPVDFPVLGQFTRYGWLGVELFFIISGYVVLMSLLVGMLVISYLVYRFVEKKGSKVLGELVNNGLERLAAFKAA